MLCGCGTIMCSCALGVVVALVWCHCRVVVVCGLSCGIVVAWLLRGCVIALLSFIVVASRCCSQSLLLSVVVVVGCRRGGVTVDGAVAAIIYLVMVGC